MEFYKTNHYQVLGLPSGIEAMRLTQKEIKKAYRAKALELHPDKQPNDPNSKQNFQILNSSYEILRDEKSRKIVDAHILRVYNRQQQQPSTPPQRPWPEQSQPSAEKPSTTDSRSQSHKSEPGQERLYFNVSWKIGDGFFFYTSNGLNKVFSQFGKVVGIFKFKQLNKSTVTAVVVVEMPSRQAAYFPSFIEKCVLGDPSNLLRVRIESP